MYRYEENFIQLFEDSFKAHASFPCITEYGSDTTLTYLDFASRLAHHHIMMDLVGIAPNAKVAICGKDSLHWVEAFMSVMTSGRIAVPILADFTPADIIHIVNHSEAEMLIIADNILCNIDPAKLTNVKVVMSLESGLPVYPKVEDGTTVLERVHEAFTKTYPDGFKPEYISYPEVNNDNVVIINYTSGTTGFSKGVMLTGWNMAGNVVFGVRARLHYPGSRVLSFLPLAHAYGCAFDLLTALAAGACITLLCRTPSPGILLKALAEVKPHLILCVPLVLEKIYKTKILPTVNKRRISRLLRIPGIDHLLYSRIKKRLVEALGGCIDQVVVGGAAFNHETEEFLRRIKFPFTVGYGMTECGPLISYTYWKEFVLESAGRTLPEIMESKVDSPDPENVPGEVCVRGQNVMLGYFKNQEATDEVIDSEGWLHTGDMGTRSADGTIFLRGRSKNMILTASGQNIYPEEIESRLANLPFVLETLVVERDGKLVALVYPDFASLEHRNISTDRLPEIMERIRKKVNGTLAAYEQISRIEIMPEEFKKTPKRSIKRYLYK